MALRREKTLWSLWEVFKRNSISGWTFPMEVPLEQGNNVLKCSKVCTNNTEVCFTIAVWWRVLPAFLQINSCQQRHTKTLAFICCTQQQAHPNLFVLPKLYYLLGKRKKMSWNKTIEVSFLRYRRASEIEADEQHLLYSLWGIPII